MDDLTDDDLPVVDLELSISAGGSQNNPVFESETRVLRYTVDDILLAREKKKETELKIEEELKEIQAIHSNRTIKIQCDGLETNLENNELQLDLFVLQHSQIKDVHPGETIFDVEQQYQLFTYSQVQLNANCDSPLRFKTSLNVIPLETLLQHAWNRNIGRSDTFESKSFIISIFYMMASHPDPLVIYKFRQTILKCLQFHKNCSKWLTHKEFLTVIFNLGASLATLIQEPEWLSFTEDDIKAEVQQYLNQDAVSISMDSKEAEKALPYQIESIVNVLSAVILYNPGHPFVELRSLLMVLSCLFIEKRFIVCQPHILTDVRACYQMILDDFSADDWTEDVINSLTDKLCDMLHHHHDAVHFLGFLPQTDRGFQVQVQTAFKAFFKFLNCPKSSDSEVDMVSELISVFSSPVLRQLDDYYLLYNVIRLLDLCICGAINSIEKKSLQVLISCVKKYFNALKDSVKCMDEPKVKTFTLTMLVKWNILAQMNKTNERTVFNSRESGTYKISEVTSYQDDTYVDLSDEAPTPDVMEESD